MGKISAHKIALVSIIVTNRNYGHFIAQALASVKNQTYRNFECIIVDDASTDNSLEIIDCFIQTDARFKLISNRQNIGQLGSSLQGLDRANGEFVCFLDSDDYYFPEFVSYHVQTHLAAYRPTSFTSSAVLTVDGQGAAIGGNFTSRDVADQRLVPNLPEETHYLIPEVSKTQYETLRRNVYFAPANVGYWVWMPGSANVIRRNILELLRPDRQLTSLHGGMDSYFLQPSFALTGATNIYVPLSAYRLHGSNGFLNSALLNGLFDGKAAWGTKADPLKKLAVITFISRTERLIHMLNYRYFEVLGQVITVGNASDSPLIRRSSILHEQDLQEAIAAQYPLLVKAYGEGSVLHELRKILGLANLRQVLIRAYPTGLPLRLRAMLFTARWHKW